MKRNSNGRCNILLYAFKKENDFLPNLELIPEEVADQAKMMILNFPWNPVPAMAHEDFFKEVIAFAKSITLLLSMILLMLNFILMVINQLASSLCLVRKMLA